MRAILAIALSLLAGMAAAAPVARFEGFTYQGRDDVRVAPGRYRNPVLSGFYSDPSVTRVGQDYYLVTSTFAYFPGIPVFKSRDLVSWTQIGNAIGRPGMLDFTGLGISRGVFAPDISHHAGTFYILNTCVDCGGNYLITAKDPAGPWSDPVWLKEIDGIDTSFFFDIDGKTWVLNNGPPPEPARYPGHRAIWIQQFDLAAKKMIGPRTVLLDGGVRPAEKPIWIEGPHIFRKDGWYYLIAAEGGTAEGHSQVVLRSRAVLGPYDPYPGNPILTQRDLPRSKVTSAGHADFVRTQAGEWWATFLATRPYGDDLYNTGRETFLLPVTWKDGWPVITRSGEAVGETHSRPKLPPQPPAKVRAGFGGPEWMMIRTPRSRWSSLDHGVLTLQARAEPLGGTGPPSFLARRQQHAWAQASTTVTFRPERDGDEAGLAAFQSEAAWYALVVGRESGRRVIALRRRAAQEEPAEGVVVAAAPIAARGAVRLKIEAKGGRYDFLYAEGRGPWRPLSRDADGTILSTKKAGGFVGVTLGPYARAAQPSR
jgi:alpha-N-arabinofuranosidase